MYQILNKNMYFAYTRLHKPCPKPGQTFTNIHYHKPLHTTQMVPGVGSAQGVGGRQVWAGHGGQRGTTNRFVVDNGTIICNSFSTKNIYFADTRVHKPCPKPGQTFANIHYRQALHTTQMMPGVDSAYQSGWAPGMGWARKPTRQQQIDLSLTTTL